MRATDTERLRRARVANPADIELLADPSGRVFHVGPTVEGVLGWTQEEYLALDPGFLLHPDDAPDLWALCEQVAARHGATGRAEFRLRHKDGSWRWMDGYSRNFLDDPEIAAIVISQRDITDLKETQQNLEDARAFLERTQAAGKVGSWTVEMSQGDPQRIALSREVYAILGVPAATPLTVDGFFARVHADDLAGVRAALREARGQLGRYDLEFRIVRAGNEIRWVRAQGEVMRAATSSTTVKFIGVLQDVTERRQQADALRVSENLYRTVFECSPLVKLLCDAHTLKLVEVNDVACRLYGYAREELLGMTLGQLCSGEEIAWVQWFGSGAAGPARARFAHRTKSNMPLEVETYLQRVRLGDRDALLLIASDLTERARLEQQVLESQKMEAIGRLAGGIAHDFNNMLSAILGFGHILMQDIPEPDPMRDDVHEIVRAAERAAALTRQLLAFSRKQILEPRVLDVGDHCRDMQAMLRRLIGETCQLRLVVEPRLRPVKVDPGQLEQVILNLVLNARDAMPDGGTITVSAQNTSLEEGSSSQRIGIEPGDYVVLSVMDTGVGVPVSARERIFEPFFTTKPVGEGTGLGLATVFGVVKQSGGHVAVDSTPGQGATFRVYLPSTTEPASTIEQPVHVDPQDDGHTVLVVEDEPAVRHLVKRALERQGFRVIAASNGGEALLIAEQHRQPIDVLVTDLVMPRMNGSQLADRLRRVRPGLEVVFMSGYTEAGVAHDGLSQPGALFVSKPIAPATLIARVREAVERRRTL